MSGLLKVCLRRVSPVALSRNFHASSSLFITNEEIVFNLKGFNKYGLLSDDLLDERDPDVAEAIRRLPEDLKMQRLHRAIRAQHAEMNKNLLPEELWTKITDNHYYMQPYLKEVIAEREEREEWEANY